MNIERPTQPPRATRRHTGTVTLSEVAALAGLSPSTVSRAIRAPEQVSVAAYEAVMRAVEEVLAEADFQLFLGTTGYDDEREEQVLRAFLGRRPDGIVLVGTSHTPGTRELLKRARIPIVETWDWTDDPIDSLVGFSNRAAAEALAEHVVKAGYRHPTFAGWLSGGDSRALARHDGFWGSISRLLPGEPVRTIDTDWRRISMDAGEWILGEVLTRHPETDVLVCASDIFASGAILAAHARDLAVPRDLAITGFGDFEISKHLPPPLTTVQTPNDEMGRRTGEVILQRIADRDAAPVSIDLGFTLVVRESA